MRTCAPLSRTVAVSIAVLTLIGACSPARAADADPFPLDLTRYLFTNFFAPKYKGPGESIPKGAQTFDGLPFQIIGQVVLYGQTLADRRQMRPDRATGIDVGSAFAELHLIHHAQWPDAEGRTIATIRLNYADGGSQVFNIGYGVHVRDWFRLPSEPVETMSDPNTIICWRGTHPAAERLKATVRLFKTTFVNPFPDKVVQSLDLVSSRQQSSYTLIAATISGKDPKRPRTPNVPPIGTERQFDGAVKITVLDADSGQPIEGAIIDHSMDVDGAGVVSPPLITPKSGEQTLRYSTTGTALIWLTVKADGYTSKSTSWRRGITGEETIPADATFRLKAGEILGGSVRDEAGAPVARARITAHGSGGEDGSYTPASVDSADDGSFKLTGVSKGARSLTIDVVHSDFPATRFTTIAGLRGQMAVTVSLEELKNRTAVLTLRRGVSLSGVVQNESGAPVEKATLRLGSRYDNNSVTGQSDENGRFELKNLLPGENSLTTQAGGYAPDTRKITVEPDAPSLVIVLGKGATIRGQVVDGEGNPIEGVQVSLANYYSPDGAETLQWQAKTDAEGKFSWGGAPAREVRLDIMKKGFRSLRGERVSPGPDTRKFVLNAAQNISGTVVDAQTGEPIDKFSVVSGWEEPSYRPGTVTDTNADAILHWQRYSTKSYTGGKFQMTITDPPVIGTTHPYDTVLMIEAAGYAPAVSTAIKPGDASPVFRFALYKAPSFTGTLTKPDGTPVPGAPIYLMASGSDGAQMNNGVIHSFGSGNAPLKSDEAGKFNVPPQFGAFLVVAATDHGFAKASDTQLTANPVLTLQPWGRVKGVWKNGKRPVVGGNLGLSELPAISRSAPRFSVYFDTTTGTNGSFNFDRVPPGTLQLYERVPMGPRSYRHRTIETVEVRPGETNHIVIGSDGALDVVGKLLRPTNLDRTISLTNGTFEIRPVVKFQTPPQELTTADEKRKWMTAWLQTSEGKQYIKAQDDVRSLQVAKDGSFTASGLTPGNYLLTAYVTRTATSGSQFLPSLLASGSASGQRLSSVISRSPSNAVASVTKEFELKAPAKEDEDKPVDLGKIPLRLHRKLKVGDVAPDFTIQTVDGKPLKLADFKGKYVLLDFWATWCGPCVAELPHLKATWDAHSKDKHFVMIGLSLDHEAEAPRTFAAKNAIEWTQGFLGDWSKDGLTKEYGVEEIPTLFLIGPNGKIVGMQLRGEKLEAAVAKALKSN